MAVNRLKPPRNLRIEFKPSPRQYELWKLLQPNYCPHCGGEIEQILIGYDQQGNPQYRPKYKKKMPYLHDVPHFLGILIHSGNTEGDSAGCIIVGKNTVKGKVLESRTTFQKLYAILESERDITIQIV